MDVVHVDGFFRGPPTYLAYLFWILDQEKAYLARYFSVTINKICYPLGIIPLQLLCWKDLWVECKSVMVRTLGCHQINILKLEGFPATWDDIFWQFLSPHPYLYFLKPTLLSGLKIVYCSGLQSPHRLLFIGPSYVVGSKHPIWQRELTENMLDLRFKPWNFLTHEGFCKRGGYIRTPTNYSSPLPFDLSQRAVTNCWHAAGGDDLNYLTLIYF
jgi:hypothetical protein